MLKRLALCLITTLVAASAAARADEAAPLGQWVKAVEGNKIGKRLGAAMVWLPDSRQAVLLGGRLEGTVGYVQAFDPKTDTWSDLSAENICKGQETPPNCQAAYDPGTQSVFCLHGEALHAFDIASRTWKPLGQDPLLKSLAWISLACDGQGKQLIAVAADKDPANLGWSATLSYDITSGKWSRWTLGDEKARRAHQDKMAALEALRELAGRTRLAWYRDPTGQGADQERRELAQRSAALAKMSALSPFEADLKGYGAHLSAKAMLSALKAARQLQRRLEEAAEAASPVPPARRNSPLVYDPMSKVMVLFGGDHEDYLTNDTWVLDLKEKTWRRMAPKLAPPPRAGHLLAHLSGCGKIAMYGGYVQNTSTDYGAQAAAQMPRELWLYDVKADAWSLAARWPGRPGEPASPPNVPWGGGFYGYSAQFYCLAAMAADADDRLILACPEGATYTLMIDPAKADADTAEKLAKAPNTRLYRGGPFLAEYCETADSPKDAGLADLPANRWIKLPASPKIGLRGCRAKDWGTAVWDGDNDQILYWGGGHCVRSASTPTHWSPASNRMVEAYDADEPYSGNGGGAYGSSILGREWCPVHGYRLYTYDPKCTLMITAYGYLYDPVRMDWLRQEPLKLPYQAAWDRTVLQGTPHGAVVWANRLKSDANGLWVFDRQKGWTDLEPVGDPGGRYCDSNGMAYDSKRDRLYLGPGGGKTAQITTFDFATKKVEKLSPANEELGRIGNSREMVYVEHADWVLFGEPLKIGENPLTRVYDAAQNRYLLLDAGNFVWGHSTGLVYDGRRKLAYVIMHQGEVWAMRLDPATAKIIQKLP